MSVIYPSLDHILNIVWDRDIDLYPDIIDWISFLIQKSGSKTETAQVIIGEQDIGKNNFFPDVISKLFEKSISNIIGRFHSSR
jgi:hypothetical protein